MRLYKKVDLTSWDSNDFLASERERERSHFSLTFFYTFSSIPIQGNTTVPVQK